MTNQVHDHSACWLHVGQLSLTPFHFIGDRKRKWDRKWTDALIIISLLEELRSNSSKPVSSFWPIYCLVRQRWGENEKMSNSISSFSINFMFGGELSLVELISSLGTFISAFDTSGITRTYSDSPKVENYSCITHENPGSWTTGRCKQ